MNRSSAPGVASRRAVAWLFAEYMIATRLLPWLASGRARGAGVIPDGLRLVAERDRVTGGP